MLLGVDGTSVVNMRCNAVSGWKASIALPVATQCASARPPIWV